MSATVEKEEELILEYTQTFESLPADKINNDNSKGKKNSDKNTEVEEIPENTTECENNAENYPETGKTNGRESRGVKSPKSKSDEEIIDNNTGIEKTQDGDAEGKYIAENNTDETIAEASFCSQFEHDVKIHSKEDFKREGNWQKSGVTKEENETEVTFKNELGVQKERNDKEHMETVEGNDKRCEPCLFDEIEETAVAFCVICIEYLCNSCARDHRRSKMTRNHKVLNQNEMPTDSNIFKMMKSMMSCPDHQDMDVSYKCEEHEKFICTTCLAVNHRKCENVKEIPSTSMASESDDTGIPLTDTLLSIHDTTVAVRIAKEDNIKKLYQDQASMSKDQSDFIESLQEHLLKLDDKSRLETEGLLKNEMEAIERGIDECKKIERSETKSRELLDVVVRYGSMAEQNVVSALIMKQVDLFKDETEKQAKIRPVHLAFKANKEFIDISSIGRAFVIRDEQNNDLTNENRGKQNTLEKSSDSEAISEVKTRDTDSNLQKGNPLMQSKINKKRIMYDIREIETGIKCSITRVLILLDGRILVTDHNNQNITVLNSDFTVKFACTVNGRPIDMCETTSNHLAVIFDSKKMVNRYIVGEDVIVDAGRFPSKLFPISIYKSQESDNQVVILFSDEERKTSKRSDNDTIEIQIRNVQSGSIVKQLTDFKSKSSQTLVLEDTGRICLIPKQKNRFLISEKKKVHCFDMVNEKSDVLKERWYFKSYKDSNIDDISDIVTDKEGNVYVCGKGSKNIHQISGKNFMQNRVLLSVPGIPLSICVDDERRLLIIGCENDDFIYVASFD